MRRLLRAIAAGSAAASLAAACGGDAPKEGFVASSLRTVPADAFDGRVSVGLGDLEVTSRLGEFEIPEAGDDEAYAGWAIDLEGRSGELDVSVILPSLLRHPYGSDVETELGFTLVDVGTFVESGIPPEQFVVLTDVDIKDINAKVGDRQDGVWQVGESEDPNFDDVTPLRRLGTALFLAERGGRVIVGTRRNMVADWARGEGGSLMDDEAFASVARRLDAVDAYSVQLVSSFEPLGPGATVDGETGVAPWSVVAVGLLPDGDRGAVIVYHHDNEDDAQANADVFEDQFRSGVVARTEEPWSDLVDLRSVQVQGSEVVVELELDEVTSLFRALMSNEPVLTAGLGR